MTDQLRQAAQQALEALEHHSAIKHPQQIHYRDTAIAALKAALEQQAEPPPEWPLIKNILAVFGLDAIAFVAEWKAAQQQAEPVEERITHITWDERGVRTVNGIPDDAPRRKELSASEILNMMPSAIPAEYDGPLMEFARAVEAKSKENT
jgi:hypothetical protein